MRKIIFTLLFTCCMSFIYSQTASILQIRMSPVNPTENDTVYFYVDAAFSSSDCHLGSSGLSGVGNQFTASATHCLGFLTAICYATDTFELLPMSAGNYVFNMELSTGASIGPMPCTPGIAPDTTAIVNFSVGPITGIETVEKTNDLFKIYPNPSNGQFTIQLKDIGERSSNHIRIACADSRLVREFNMITEKKQVNLSKGVYFLQLKNDQMMLTTKKLIVTD